MIDDKDIVNDIFLRVREILGPDFKGNIRMKLEKEEIAVRKDWGGAELYVNKHPERRERRKKVQENFKKGMTIPELMKEQGISRTQVYALLKRK